MLLNYEKELKKIKLGGIMEAIKEIRRLLTIEEEELTLCENMSSEQDNVLKLRGRIEAYERAIGVMVAYYSPTKTTKTSIDERQYC